MEFVTNSCSLNELANRDSLSTQDMNTTVSDECNGFQGLVLLRQSVQSQGFGPVSDLQIGVVLVERISELRA